MDINTEFSEENGIADLTLIVEDHRIPVCKSVLSIASPVFRGMLEGDFKEKTKTAISLPGKKYDDFVEFLKCIYPDKMKKVNENTVYMLLPLAHEYYVGKLVKRCQKVLIQIVKNYYTENVEQLYRHINMSETYNLEELKENGIYLASEHTINKLKNAKLKYEISDTSQFKVLELALRRHEIDNVDERDISISARNWLYDRHGKRSDAAVKLEFTGEVILNVANESECLKALRLMQRVKSENSPDPRFMANLLKRLQGHDNKGRHQEQFDLLPESIKSSLQ